MQSLHRFLILAGCCVLLSISSFGPLHAADPPVSFNRDIRPILSDHCFACHGLDAEQRQADLRLDTFEGAVADLGGYQAIVPGDVENSELWKRIVSKEDDVMPPTDFHKPLNEEQTDLIGRWIESGAAYEKHWAFVPPKSHEIPNREVENPIDSFLRKQMEGSGLEPNPPADKETLVRRLSLDLTGFPPTPEEVDAFLKNDSPSAYEELVDALQARVTYGEHMARYWLDLARYADTHGLHLDNERTMWPYRDWVVRAINQNLAFDDFTRWQLAGDLLPEPTQDQLIASGFNRCNVTTSEGGSINEEWIYRYAVDRTATAVEVWMGLTAGCAVCHDHKFDPLSTKEFYSMYAFFHSAADPAMDGNKKDTPPILKLVTEKDQARAAELRDQLAKIDAELEQEIATLLYEDPALLDPAPSPQEITEVWFEDGPIPGGTIQASGGPALQMVAKEDGPVFRGESAIRRKSNNTISQDIFFYRQKKNFRVPENGKFFIYCHLDPADTPETVMIQLHTTTWKNRAVWGKQEKITFGQPNTTEKVFMGDLPEAGKWARLEFDAAKVGLAAGTKITGFAFTQFGGTVGWDHFGVESKVDKAKDISWSWSLWTAQDYSVLRKALPDELRRELQGRTPDKWSEEETEKVQLFWLRNVYAGAQEIVNASEQTKAPIQKQMQDIENNAPYTFVMADLPKPRESFVMIRGAYDNPGEKVTRGVPAFLPQLEQRKDGQDYNRLDLANWLLRPDHPLTSRVVVNRFWQQLFGVGLVKTSADFGSQGQVPSHPELLDWLALQFIEDGWDMKQLVKRIVTSHAYMQSSRVTPVMLEVDPENRLLSHAPRLRLDAEVLRDQALYVSGLLVPTLGGPGVKPYQPPNIWEPVGFGNSNTRYYKQDSGDSLYRRSLYTFLKRTAPPPFMSTFDAPNREQSCSLRGRSNTPMQALQLMNDVQHVEAARAFAQRILTEGGQTADSRIGWAWRVVTSRIPTDDELQIAKFALQQHQQRYANQSEDAQQLTEFGESKPSAELAKEELAAYTLLANLILNLDESVSKN
ncbi:MAG: PSD1 and planctomycete cytochrome C domain-containing protein [Planctomycetota bacterium]